MSLLPDLNKTSAKTSILGGGTQPLRSPKIKILGDTWDDFNVGFNLLLYGSPGTGKTHFLSALVESGEKVLIVTTDAGGNVAINTIKANLIRAKGANAKQWLTDHLRFVYIPVGDQVGEGRDSIVSFFSEIDKDPNHELWQFKPTVLVWEGFSTYQSNYIVDEFDDSDGAVENFKQWGKINTATIRDSEQFFKIASKYSAALIRVVTCQEGIKSVMVKVGTDREGKPIMEREKRKTGEPHLQTGAAQFFRAAFDGVIRMDKTPEGKFIYEIVTQGTAGKQRVILPPKMDADPMKVWSEFKTQLGLTA